MKHTSGTQNTFADQVRAMPGGEHLEACFSCGTCVSKCMIQQKVEPEYNPRRLLRLVMMGLREEAFTSPTTWLCSACDLCYPSLPTTDPHLGRHRRGQTTGCRSRLQLSPGDGRGGRGSLRWVRHLRHGLPLRSTQPG